MSSVEVGSAVQSLRADGVDVLNEKDGNGAESKFLQDYGQISKDPALLKQVEQELGSTKADAAPNITFERNSDGQVTAIDIQAGYLTQPSLVGNSVRSDEVIIEPTANAALRFVPGEQTDKVWGARTTTPPEFVQLNNNNNT